MSNFRRAHSLYSYLVWGVIIAFATVFLCTDALRVKETQASVSALPAPAKILSPAKAYSEPVLKGLRLDPKDPFHIEFIADVNDAKKLSKDQADRLLKFFLAALTVPEKDIWVNLSPFEKDRVTSESLEKTEMGEMLLGQDYVLKQLASSVTYPESKEGKLYWDELNKRMAEELGTLSLPVNTFNKIWIVPGTADLMQSGTAVYIVDSSMKLMTEEDYLARSKQTEVTDTKAAATVGALSSAVLKEKLLPIIDEQVNRGAYFSAVRQIYNAVLLAAWFKQTFKDSFYKHYIDQAKTAGANPDDPAFKAKVFALYQEAFKKGVYSLTKNVFDPIKGEDTHRRFFSGGVTEVGAGKLAARPEIVSSGVLAKEMASNPGLVQISSSIETKPVDMSEKAQVLHEEMEQKFDAGIVNGDIQYYAAVFGDGRLVGGMNSAYGRDGTTYFAQAGRDIVTELLYEYRGFAYGTRPGDGSDELRVAFPLTKGQFTNTDYLRSLNVWLSQELTKRYTEKFAHLRQAEITLAEDATPAERATFKRIMTRLLQSEEYVAVYQTESGAVVIVDPNKKDAVDTLRRECNVKDLKQVYIPHVFTGASYVKVEADPLKQKDQVLKRADKILEQVKTDAEAGFDGFEDDYLEIDVTPQAEVPAEAGMIAAVNVGVEESKARYEKLNLVRKAQGLAPLEVDTLTGLVSQRSFAMLLTEVFESPSSYKNQVIVSRTVPNEFHAIIVDGRGNVNVERYDSLFYHEGTEPGTVGADGVEVWTMPATGRELQSEKVKKNEEKANALLNPQFDEQGNPIVLTHRIEPKPFKGVNTWLDHDGANEVIKIMAHFVNEGLRSRRPLARITEDINAALSHAPDGRNLGVIFIHASISDTAIDQDNEFSAILDAKVKTAQRARDLGFTKINDLLANGGVSAEQRSLLTKGRNRLLATTHGHIEKRERAALMLKILGGMTKYRDGMGIVEKDSRGRVVAVSKDGSFLAEKAAAFKVRGDIYDAARVETLPKLEAARLDNERRGARTLAKSVDPLVIQAAEKAKAENVSSGVKTKEPASAAKASSSLSFEQDILPELNKRRTAGAETVRTETDLRMLKDWFERYIRMSPADMRRFMPGIDTTDFFHVADKTISLMTEGFKVKQPNAVLQSFLTQILLISESKKHPGKTVAAVFENTRNKSDRYKKVVAAIATTQSREFDFNAAVKEIIAKDPDVETMYVSNKPVFLTGEELQDRSIFLGDYGEADADTIKRALSKNSDLILHDISDDIALFTDVFAVKDTVYYRSLPVTESTPEVKAIVEKGHVINAGITNIRDVVVDGVAVKGRVDGELNKLSFPLTYRIDNPTAVIASFQQAVKAALGRERQKETSEAVLSEIESIMLRSSEQVANAQSRNEMVYHPLTYFFSAMRSFLNDPTNAPLQPFFPIYARVAKDVANTMFPEPSKLPGDYGASDAKVVIAKYRAEAQKSDVGKLVDQFFGKELEKLDTRGDDPIVSVFRHFLSDAYKKSIQTLVTMEAADTHLTFDEVVFRALVLQMAGSLVIKDTAFTRGFVDFADVIKGMLAEYFGSGTSLTLDGVPPTGRFVLFPNQDISGEDFKHLRTVYGNRLAAIVVLDDKFGGAAKHYADTDAKSLGIPVFLATYSTVFDKDGKEIRISSFDALTPGEKVVADSEAGRVILNPTRTELLAAKKHEALQRIMDEVAEENVDKGHRNPQGVLLPIVVNIGTAEESDAIVNLAVPGVGLYRTEFEYTSQDIPAEITEADWYEKLKRIVKNTKKSHAKFVEVNNPSKKEAVDPFVIVRLLDRQLIETDMKDSSIFGTSNVDGFDFIVQDPVGKALNRNIIRAAMMLYLEEGTVEIEFPMVGSAEDMEKAQRMIMSVRSELVKEKGLSAADAARLKEMPILAMFETPGAISDAEGIIAQSSGGSIGSNDLTTFMSGKNRGQEGAPALDRLYRKPLQEIMKLLAVRAKVAPKYHLAWCGTAAASPGTLAKLLQEAAIGDGAAVLPGIPVGLVAKAKNIARNIDLESIGPVIDSLLKAETDGQFDSRVGQLEKSVVRLVSQSPKVQERLVEAELKALEGGATVSSAVAPTGGIDLAGVKLNIGGETIVIAGKDVDWENFGGFSFAISAIKPLSGRERTLAFVTGAVGI